jgi:uncharacterized protein (UPF0303 family)
MLTLKDQLELLLRQEEEIQFDRFTHETAMEIGLLLYENACKQGHSLAIDITRNGHCLFHYSMVGTSRDNSEWILRKNSVVNRFSHSSYYMAIFLKSLGMTMEGKYNLSPSEYAASGGGFPLAIRHVGVIGTISVSGLPGPEDHEFIVNGLREYLSKISSKNEGE